MSVPLPPPPNLAPRRAKDARPSAAILTLESSAPGEKLDVAALTDVFAAALDEARWFRLVAPRDVTAALALERQKELLGCSVDQSCLAELAGALGVDYVAAASVGRVGESLLVSARLIDPRRGAAVARSSVTAEPEQLVAAVGDAARELLASYRVGRPAGEQARLVLPERHSGPSGRLALRLGGVFGYAPGADAGVRGSVGGEAGLAWRVKGPWTLTATGVAGPNPGFRVGVMRQLTGGGLRLSAGLRGAGWPGAPAYGGGAVLEAAVGLTRSLDLVGTIAGEGYATERRYGQLAALGGLGFSLRL